MTRFGEPHNQEWGPARAQYKARSREVLIRNCFDTLKRRLGIRNLGAYSRHDLPFLEEVGDPNVKDEHGETLFDISLTMFKQMRAEAGMELCKLLFEYGVEPNRRDRDGNSLLHLLADFDLGMEGYCRFVELLLDNGVSIDVLNKEGKTPLRMAARYSDYNRGVMPATVLVEKGAELDIQDKDGDSALHLAAQAGNQMLVEFLLERNAKEDIKNGSGKNPMALASEKVCKDVYMIFWRRELNCKRKEREEKEEEPNPKRSKGKEIGRFWFWLQVFVNHAAVAYLNDGDGQYLVSKIIDYSVLSDSDAIDTRPAR